MNRRSTPDPTLAAALALALALATTGAPATLAAGPAQGAAADTAVATDPVTIAGRELTTLFYRGELKQVHERFSDEMQREIPLSDLQGFLKRVGDEMGVEKALLDENVVQRGDYRVYVRRVSFDKYPEDVVVVWMFRQDDKVGGFFIRPAASLAPPDTTGTPDAPDAPDAPGGDGDDDGDGGS